MFKKEFNENELAAIELLEISPECAVVTKNKDGKYYVIDILEDEEDESAPFEVRMFEVDYRFKNGQESSPKRLVGAVDFHFDKVLIDGEHLKTTLIVHPDKLLLDAFTRDSIYKFLEGFARYTNNEYKDHAAEPIQAIIIQGVSFDGRKNDFAPYANLGYSPIFHDRTASAIKESENFSARKFNNNFEELYNYFETKIQSPSEKV